MEWNYAQYHYSAVPVEDRQQGFVGLELYRSVQGAEKVRVARVLYWDASGQHFLETFNVDLPFNVIERLIAETRSSTHQSK